MALKCSHLLDGAWLPPRISNTTQGDYEASGDLLLQHKLREFAGGPEHPISNEVGLPGLFCPQGVMALVFYFILTTVPSAA